MVYFHLTQKGTEEAVNLINQTMKGFAHDFDK